MTRGILLKMRHHRRWQFVITIAVALVMANGMSAEAGTWREFRARLAKSELPCVGDTSQHNSLRLKRQNEALWREHIEGAWAHETSLPEPGGLLCALPLQGQLISELRESRSDHDGWVHSLREKLLVEISDEPAGSPDGLDGAALQRWLNLKERSPACYGAAWKACTSVVDAAFREMRGGLMPTSEQRALWKRQCAALDNRGQVCLVLDDAGSCVLLTKPMASHVDHTLARRLLIDTTQTDFDSEVLEERVSRFVQAFGTSPVYDGGPSGKDEGGLVIHGNEGVRGSREVSPGTRVYRAESTYGGLDAIVDAVLRGEAQPNEFRLFLGQHSRSQLAGGAGGGPTCAWQPVACSRPLILKHSVGLPKPLWHEVMALCGGQCAEMSRLVRREDGGSGETAARRHGNSAEDTTGR